MTMEDNDKLLLDDDERYLAEGRDDDDDALAKPKKKEKKIDEKPGQVSWRFFLGLSLILFGLGFQAVVPFNEENWLYMYLSETLIQLAACVSFFFEFLRLRAAGGKRWKTYTLASVIVLSLAGGVALGVVLMKYVS